MVNQDGACGADSGSTCGLLRKVSRLLMQPPSLLGLLHSEFMMFSHHVFWRLKKDVFITRQMDMVMKYLQ